MDPNQSQTQPTATQPQQPVVSLAHPKQTPQIPIAGVVPGAQPQQPKTPKKPRTRIKGLGWLFNGMINKDTIMLGVIILLIVMVLALGAFVVGSMTNSGVAVSFTTEQVDNTSTDETTTDAPTNDDETPDDSSTSPSDTDTQTQGTELTGYMLAYLGDNPDLLESQLPVGAKPFSSNGQLFAYIVPIPFLDEAEEGKELDSALYALFGQSEIVFQGISLRNLLQDSDMIASVTTDFTGTLVALNGSLNPVSDLEADLMREQITQTIEAYINDYTVTYNGTVDGFTELGFVGAE